MRVNSGLSNEAKTAIAERLAVTLADIHRLYIKTLGFHWNVEDPRFLLLHELFEAGYVQLAKDMDQVAERIRKLGILAPGSVQQLTSLSRLEDAQLVKVADQMVEMLASDYEKLEDWLREDIELADRMGDPGTADMLTSMLRQYEKQAWFLRSHL